MRRIPQGIGVQAALQVPTDEDSRKGSRLPYKKVVVDPSFGQIWCGGKKVEFDSLGRSFDLGMSKTSWSAGSTALFVRSAKRYQLRASQTIASTELLHGRCSSRGISSAALTRQQRCRPGNDKEHRRLSSRESRACCQATNISQRRG